MSSPSRESFHIFYGPGKGWETLLNVLPRECEWNKINFMRCLIFFLFFSKPWKEASPEKLCNKRESCLWILYVGRIIIMVIASFLHIQTPFRIGHGHGALLIVNFPALNSTSSPLLGEIFHFNFSHFSGFFCFVALSLDFDVTVRLIYVCHTCHRCPELSTSKKCERASVGKDPGKRSENIWTGNNYHRYLHLQFHFLFARHSNKKIVSQKRISSSLSSPRRKDERQHWVCCLLDPTHTHSVLYTTFFLLFYGHILNGYGCVIVWMAVGRQ